MEPCPLADPALGIVTEMEHKVGACFCALCTCGEHACPARTNRPKTPSLVSSYRQAYVQHKAQRLALKCPSSSPYRPNLCKFDGETSMRRDFRKYEVQDTLRKETRSVSPMLKHSVSYSSYQRDFPNWGPAGVPSKHVPSLPLRNQEVHFSGTSTYDQHFLPLAKSVPRPQEPKLRAQGGSQTSVQLPDNTRFSMGTTARRDYSDPAAYTSINKRVKAPVEQFLQLQSPDCHHATTSRQHYQLREPCDRSAILRKKLLLRRRLAA